MDIRPIADGYAVSPQIAPNDVAALAADGYRVIICNRPDAEAPWGQDSAAMRAAVEAAGLTFVDNPVTHPTINAARVATQAEAMARGKTLAYCASGMRSSVLWGLAQREAGMATDAVIAATRAAGYDHEPLRPRYDAI